MYALKSCFIFNEEWGIYMLSQYLPTELLITGEKSNFTEKPGRQHLNQVIEVNISNGTNQNYAPPDWVPQTVFQW